MIILCDNSWLSLSVGSFIVVTLSTELTNDCWSDKTRILYNKHNNNKVMQL
jgi:hypothetical protein